MFIGKYFTTKQTEHSPFMLSVSKLISIVKMAKKATTNVTTLLTMIMGVQGLRTVIQIHGEGMEMTCGLHEIHNMLIDLEDSNDIYVKDYTHC